MNSTQHLAVIMILIFEGILVGQQKFVSWPTNLPQFAELLEDLPQAGLELQDRTWEARSLLRATDASLAKLDPKHKSFPATQSQLKSYCSYFLQRLGLEYSKCRSEGRAPTIPMMQLLLLCRISCFNPECYYLQWPEKIVKDKGVTLKEVAYDLLRVAETEEDRLSAYLYLLHEGDVETRIQTAMILAQMNSLTLKVVPHLIEELWDEEKRVVQEGITALGMIGPAAKVAIPALEKLTEHEDRQIAERASAALRQIRGVALHAQGRSWLRRSWHGSPAESSSAFRSVATPGGSWNGTVDVLAWTIHEITGARAIRASVPCGRAPTSCGRGLWWV